MTHHLYWGDLHSHCSISYGHGTVQQALLRARQQLDFCSVTGHAFWPDMPTDREQYADIIDYHTRGFATLAGNWEELLRLQREASHDGEFLALPSYEWHSLEFGDHNVYAAGPELPLRDAADLPQLRRMCAEAGLLAIPHHIGYRAGYRGIDWDAYREDVSPFVEIFSLHGCSLSDDAPYPMLHDMGPRDSGSTAEEGWRRGHKFGIVGGTDHHAAYPGSHGDGRMGVFADSLTREALFEAVQSRRVFAATGDRIAPRMWINDAFVGEQIKSAGGRMICIDVHASDALDKVELIKNGRILERFFPTPVGNTPAVPQRYRLRLTWGWGRNTVPVDWTARLTLSDGEITTVEPLFSGQAVVAPKSESTPGPRRTRGADTSAPGDLLDGVDLPHAINGTDRRSVDWRSITTGNKTMRHESTQGLSLEVDAPLSASVQVEVNAHRYQHPLAELLHAGRTHLLRGWLSEAFRIGPLVPIEECTLTAVYRDAPDQPTDTYRLNIAQKNHQWAWLSPIWAER
jgi:hypothetical protein